MIPTPFLSALGSRVAVKGSRDRHGIQSLWVAQARKVIGNLTAVTSKLRDFTLTLMGYPFADRIGAEEGPGHADVIFLKWGQLAAYARFLVNDETGFRGTERVHMNRDWKRFCQSKEYAVDSDSVTVSLGEKRKHSVTVLEEPNAYRLVARVVRPWSDSESTRWVI